MPLPIIFIPVKSFIEPLKGLSGEGSAGWLSIKAAFRTAIRATVKISPSFVPFRLLFINIIIRPVAWIMCVRPQFLPEVRGPLFRPTAGRPKAGRRPEAARVLQGGLDVDGSAAQAAGQGRTEAEQRQATH